jgi:hypothetical protein
MLEPKEVSFSFNAQNSLQRVVRHSGAPTLAA